EPRGVEAEPADRVAPAPASAVAHDGVAEVGELDPDLVAPAGPQAELDQRRVPAALEDAEVGDRLAPFHAATQGAALGPDAPLDAGDVDALRTASLELVLEAALDRGRLRDDQEPGGVPIEPVDDEGASPRAGGRQVVPEEPVGRAVPLALGGDREEAGGLVDDDEVLVLVH